MTKNGESKFEVLRLLAIFFIVVSHFSFHGYYLDPGKYEWINCPENRIILKSLNLGSLGVDIFILLCGYFSIYKDKVNYLRLIDLELSVMFYTQIVYIIYLCFGGKFVIRDLLPIIFPTCYGVYWFFSVYIILAFLTPYINKLFLPIRDKERNKKQHLLLLGAMLFAWSFVPTFLGTSFYGDEVPTFIMLYVLGAYIRLYDVSMQKNKRIIFTSLEIIAWISIPVLGEFTKNVIPVFTEHATYFYSRNSLLTIILATQLVLNFREQKMKSNAYINYLATLVFGIYLIDDNYWIRIWVYDNLFHCKEQVLSGYLLLYVLICSLIITVACMLIESIRRKVFSYIVPKITNSIPFLKRQLNEKII